MAIADNKFYYPTDREYDRPENYGLGYEEVFFPSTGDNTLHGWFFPAQNARGTIIHCHGNAGNITAHFKFVDWLPQVGWNVLCFDYRGYGQSTGSVSRRGIIDDVVSAIRYASARSDVLPGRICLFGQSLGGAVGIVASTECDGAIAGICIEGAFSSYRTEARFVTRKTWYLWSVSGLISRYLISDDFSPIDYVSQLPDIPKMFICGVNDRIVDFRQTVDLYNAATAPKSIWQIPDSDHTEAVTGEIEGGRERVVDFFDTCMER